MFGFPCLLGVDIPIDDILHSGSIPEKNAMVDVGIGCQVTILSLFGYDFGAKGE